MAQYDLAGKAIIVTGAGSGLGQAMALGLAEAGGAVLALDVDQSRAEDTVAAAKAAGAKGQILPFACDVRRESECAAAIDAARSKLGGLTGLVNCAGLGMAHLRPDAFARPPKFWEADPQRWQDMIDVNVRGPFLMARAATPVMTAQKWGRIVNVTTSFNTMLRGGNMPYGQTKAALEAASSSWHDDLKDTGVTVNVLVPGGAADTRLVPDDAPYPRSALIKPTVMVAPIQWLMSNQSDGISGMRYIGRLWDPQADWRTAAEKAGGRVAWPQLAAQAAAAGQPVAVGRKESW
ncbi:MAG: SDR family NAD(P)-dependent oxidoreductase [Hyphomicrobiaceae bacterium]